MKNIHFIGIHGSAISGVACLAKSLGYKVTGCNLTTESDYKQQLANAGIVAEIGYSKEHLKDIDAVVCAADLYHGKNIPEEAKIALDAGKLIKWQHFLGKYIFPNYKNVIGVCGTHGKTTTTSLLAITLQNLGLDPTAIVGGIIPSWNSATRLGKSDWLVCEADEYEYNFIMYNPKIVIFNNLEMEHPERFNNYEEYIQTFHDFFLTIQNNGMLICNVDDKNSMDLIRSLHEQLKAKSIKIVGYANKEDNANQNKDIIDKIYLYDIKDVSGKFTTQNQNYELSIFGRHNISNAMGVVVLCSEIGIDQEQLKKAIKNFIGPKRRLEKVYDTNGIRIFNDYAHHHTQVRVSLETLKESYPNEKLIAVLEPHQISRISQNSEGYLNALDIADNAFINKIYEGREKGKDLPDMNKLIGNHSKIKYIEDFEELANEVFSLSKDGANIIIMGAAYKGAGNSYKIIENLKTRMA